MRQRAVDLGLDVVPQDGDGETADQAVINVDGEDTSSDGDLYEDSPAPEKRAAGASSTVSDGDRRPKAERNKITRSRTEQIARQDNSPRAGGSPRLSRSVGSSPVITHKESSFFPGYSNVRDSSRLVRRKLIEDLPLVGNEDDETTVDADHDEDSGEQRASSSPTEEDGSNYSRLKRSESSRRIATAATAVHHASRLRKKRPHTAGGLPVVDATSLWLKLDTMGVWSDLSS